MKTLYFLLILSLSSLSNAWIIGDLGEFTFKKITDNVFVIHGPLSNPNVKNQGFMNNPGIVIGDTGIIVIDPGSTYKVGKNILKEIHKISKNQFWQCLIRIYMATIGSATKLLLNNIQTLKFTPTQI